MVRWSRAVGEADWIRERLATHPRGVSTSVVPGGFPAYVRLLHPAADDGRTRQAPVRWTQVAAWSGMPLRPDAGFHSVALPPGRPPEPAPWSLQGPRLGSLSADDAGQLVAHLSGATSTPERCWFCLWAGCGWESSARLVATTGDGAGAVRTAPAGDDPVPAEVRRGPLVRLPGREYLLYEGPITEALAFLDHWQQTPNLWWPDDRAWCVASEIDLAWTYVGGRTALIERLGADPRLETLRAWPGQPLWQVEPWVRRWVEGGVEELLSAGDCVIDTACGTLRAVLVDEGRGPDPRWLRVSRTGGDGSWGESRSRLRAGADLREQLGPCLTMAVLSLVDG